MCHFRQFLVSRPTPGHLVLVDEKVHFRCSESTPESRQNALQSLDGTCLVQLLEI